MIQTDTQGTWDEILYRLDIMLSSSFNDAEGLHFSRLLFGRAENYVGIYYIAWHNGG